MNDGRIIDGRIEERKEGRKEGQTEDRQKEGKQERKKGGWIENEIWMMLEGRNGDWVDRNEEGIDNQKERKEDGWAEGMLKTKNS